MANIAKKITLILQFRELGIIYSQQLLKSSLYIYYAFFFDRYTKKSKVIFNRVIVIQLF